MIPKFKVKSTELRYKTTSSDIWTVAKTMSVFRTLEETLVDLDICQDYQIVLHLEGTVGNQGLMVNLANLTKPTKEKMKEAYDTGKWWGEEMICDMKARQKIILFMLCSL